MTDPNVEESLRRRFQELARIFQTLPDGTREEITRTLRGIEQDLKRAFAFLAPVANWGVCFAAFVKLLEDLSGGQPPPPTGGKPPRPAPYPTPERLEMGGRKKSAVEAKPKRRK